MHLTATDLPDLRDYQSAAVQAAAGCARGLTVMACGTGKTRVAAHAGLDDSDVPQVVVFVPTLALLEQTYNAWAEVSSTKFSALGVCSQPIRGSEDIALADLTLPTTTNAENLAEQVQRFRENGSPTVVFATYQSAAVIAEAHRNHDLPAWTTMVCDEAHRLAGPRRKAFAIVLYDDAIPARRRLFYTATPRIHAAGRSTELQDVTTSRTVASMDNSALFGEKIYTLSTRDAIDQGWLSDYRLAVIAVTAEEVRDTLSRFAKVDVGDHTITTRDAATIIALHKAVDDYNLRSVLAFHNTISASQQFTAAIEPLHTALGDTRPVTATHVDGTDSLTIRRDALTTLHTPPDDGWAIVSNARCFSEGIDVPALDAVLFAEARTSPIDVAQAVGRAIRRNPHRTEPSLIILAVIVDTNEDPENAIDDSEFAKTRRVIAALEDHDPAIATDLTKLRQHATGGEPPTTTEDTTGEEQQHVDVRAHDPHNRLLDRYLTAFTTRLLPPTNDQRWEERFTELQEFVAEHGHARPPQSKALGSWVANQRRAFRAGTLDESRTRRLEALDGWVWNTLDARWEEQFAELQEFVAEHGHARPPNSTVLGSWVANQRQAFRAGTLDESRTRRLEALDGWVWKPLQGRPRGRSQHLIVNENEGTGRHER